MAATACGGPNSDATGGEGHTGLGGGWIPSGTSGGAKARWVR